MQTLEEIESAVHGLSRQELIAFREWFDEYCEDALELSDQVVAAIAEARTEISAGNFRTRQP